MSNTAKEMLLATALRVEYDFVAFVGRLYMARGDCCDMSGCISFFKRIDPNVIYISTYSGPDADTSYRLIDNEWQAFKPFSLRLRNHGQTQQGPT